MKTAALKRIDAYEEENAFSTPHETLPAWRDKDTSLSPLPFRDNVSGKTRSPKVAVTREEFVDLTQDPFVAMILNQLLYWSRRVKDFDLFLEEEKTFHSDSQSPAHYGWFYKSATELSEETMLGVTKVTMRKHLHFLIEKGWISERSNPLNKWDRTTQYRVNLRQLQVDLQKLGWDLPGFPKGTFIPHAQKISFEEQKQKLQENWQIPACLENDTSRVEKLNLLYLTETTSESTNKEHTQDACVREVEQRNGDLKKSEKLGRSESLKTLSCPLESMTKAWKAHVGQEAYLTEERKHRLHSVLVLHFQNDLSQWERFCERVAHSPFLMGQGARKWRVSLDWVLVQENLLKVLEGNFDDGTLLDQKTESISADARKKEIGAVLASIEDPVWRRLCSQLDFSLESHEFVSLGDLKSIANARFLEVEDDRLVWIGSVDPHVLSRIEDLRLKLSSSVKRMFPQTRSIRTRLEEENSSLQQKITDHSIEKISLAPQDQNLHENRQISACLENDTSKLSFSTFESRLDDTSRVEKLNLLYLTETTSEITNKEHAQKTSACEVEQKNGDLKKSEKLGRSESLKTLSCPLERMASAWKVHVGQETYLTEERKHRLHFVLVLYFENDLAQWEQFCKRVANSPFLMGQDTRKWRVSLDWILVEENLLKVLEGNFDDGSAFDQKTEQVTEDARKREINDVIASIEDPVWRKLCSQLDFSPESHEFISLGDLKAIVNARFLELEDDRLVWIGSSDPHVLSRIDDLRLKLSTSVKRMFPQTRSLRTRLDEENPSLRQQIPGSQTISTNPIHQQQGVISI